MFAVLILDDRCRVKHLSKLWSQSIYLKIDVPLLLLLFWCNAGSLSRRKDKKTQNVPRQDYGMWNTNHCEMKSIRLYICKEKKQKKKEEKRRNLKQKIHTNIKHTYWDALTKSVPAVLQHWDASIFLLLNCLQTSVMTLSKLWPGRNTKTETYPSMM